MLESALQWLGNARQAADGMANGKEDVLSMIAEVQAKAGDIILASQTARDINDGFSRNQAWRAIAVAQAQAGDIVASMHTLAEVDDTRVIQDALEEIAAIQARACDAVGVRKTTKILSAWETKQRVLATTAVILAEVGDFAGALKNAKLLYDPYTKASTLTKIAALYVKAGDVTRARRVVSAVNGKFRKAIAWAEIQAMAGDFAGAKQSLARAKGLATEIRKSYRRYFALEAIVLLQIRVGDVASAYETAAQVRDSEGSVNLTSEMCMLNKIAMAQAKAGDMAGAQRTFERSQHIAAGMGDADDEAKALPHRAACQRHAGDFAGAKATIAEMSDGESRLEALGDLTRSLAEAGDIDGAKRTAAEIDHPGHRMMVSRYIATAEAMAGNVAQARRLAEEMDQSTVVDYCFYANTLLDIQRAVRARAAAQAQGGASRDDLAWIAACEAPVDRAYGWIGAAEGLLALHAKGE